MIRTEGLTKHFERSRKSGRVVAVNRLDLEVVAGEVLGFLGPNGAGKTTTVRMLCTLIGASGGRAWVNGLEVGRRDAEIRASVGVLTEQPGLYDRLSAHKNLDIYARLYGVKNPAGQAEKYLRLLGLWERRHDPVGAFSKGMKQKLAIARAILHEPATLFLDEPTSGLDPEASKLVRDFIEQMKAAGRTIFLCTHNLDEADRLCDRVAVFKQRLLRVDSPKVLRAELFGRTVEFRLRRGGPALADVARRFEFVKSVQSDEDRLLVGLDDPDGGNPLLIKALVAAGAELQSVQEVRRSLEDVYLSLIGGARP